MWLRVSPSFTWYCPQPGDPAVMTPAVSSGTAIPVSTRTTLPIPSISPGDCHLTVSAGTDVTKGANGVLVAPDMQCSQFNAELHGCTSQTPMTKSLLRATDVLQSGSAFQRGRGIRGVITLRNPPRAPSVASGNYRVPHRGGHQCGVFGPGDRGRQQYRVAAEFHGQRGVARRTDSRVQHDRHVELVDDHADVVWVADPQPGTDRGTQRHHGRTTRLSQPSRQDRVVVGVGEHLEPICHQLLGSIEQLNWIGQQGVVV